MLPNEFVRNVAHGQACEHLRRQNRLSEPVDRAAAGEEIISAKAGEPMGRLVPVRAVHERRVFGQWVSQMVIVDDFDAPLPEELLRAFEGDHD